MQDLKRDLSYLFEYEKFDLGYAPRDLNGKIYLKTALSHLESYLKKIASKYPVEKTDSLYSSLSISDWALLPKFLFENFVFEKQDLQKSISKYVSFFNWLKMNHLPDLFCESIQRALKFGQKEIERAMLIHKRIAEFSENQSIPQYQNFDLKEIELELSWMQFQSELEETQVHQGHYELISKSSEENKIYLNDVKRQKKIMLSFPKGIFELLQKGDKFYLHFEENSKGHSRFIKISYLTPTPLLEG